MRFKVNAASVYCRRYRLGHPDEPRSASQGIPGTHRSARGSPRTSRTGTLEKARQMAAHASTRTTQLYDRREDRVTLDEVVKINIQG
jgi:hypothetical protein